MKRFVLALIVLALIACPAMAEPVASDAPVPTPTPIPAGEAFVSDELSLNLPYGLKLMDETALAGYEAAVQADFEDMARTLALASDDSGAMMLLVLCDSSADCTTAASEAAQDILGEGAAVTQLQFGDNACAAFACSIQDREYRIYFFSNGTQLLCVGTSGLTDAQISASLESLKF